MPNRKSKIPIETFKRGDKVRVRHGVKDTDYPDMPIGGWAGVIAEVHDDGMFTVRWSKETLAAIHPVFKKRCEKDGLEFETYRIGSDELERDPAGPLDIEQPKQITSKPLSQKNRDDRVRMVFGLTSDDPLPEVDDGSLLVYHAHLSKNLAFPFTAEHGEEYGPPERVMVVSLGEPDDEPMLDEMYGLLCEARMEGQMVTLPLAELEDVKPNRQLIDDYRYWFRNWG